MDAGVQLRMCRFLAAHLRTEGLFGPRYDIMSRVDQPFEKVYIEVSSSLGEVKARHRKVRGSW